MITRLWRGIFGLRYNYTNPVDRRRAQALLIGLWLLLIINLGLNAVVQVPNFVAGSADLLNVLLLFIPLIALPVAIYQLQRGQLQIAAALSIGYILLIVLLAVAVQSPNSSAFALLAIPIVLGGLLLERRQFLLFSGVGAAGVLAMLLATSGNLSALLGNNTLVWATIGLVLIGLLFVIFTGASDVLVNQLLDNTQQLGKVSEFGMDTAFEGENAAYAAALDLIKQGLNYSFAQVFMIDDAGNLTQRLRTGVGLPEIGMMTSVSISTTSALQEAMRTEETVVVSANDAEARRDYFLPSSTYSAVIPLYVEDELVGVLDVQSSETPFNLLRLNVLETLGRRLSQTVAQVRQVNALRSSLDVQEDITENLREQVRELRQSERAQISAVWEGYLQHRNKQAVGFDLQPDETKGTALTMAEDLPADLREVIARGEVAVQQGETQQVIRVPIQVRGEVLGAMAFTVDSDQPVTDRQIEFAQSVTTRLALALENKRLFEQSQALAQRERKVNEVAGTLLGATEVQDVLRLAAENFNEALGAVTTRVRLDAEALRSNAPEDQAQRPHTSNNGDSVS